MNNEEKLIYDITNNIWDSSYTLNDSDCTNIDWMSVLRISIEQGIFPVIYHSIEHYIPKKYKLAYVAQKMRHQSRSKIALNECYEVSKMFTDKNIRHVMVKGFALSHLIYEKYLMRQFGDIDFLVNEDDIVSACYEMESAGYFENLINDISNSGLVVEDYHKKAWYLGNISDIGDSEKTFSGKNTMVELKKEKSYYGVSEVAAAISNSIDIVICGYKFKSLSIEDSFIFSIENMFHNFYSVAGICTDYALREIVDFYKFILKHENIFTFDYIETIERSNHKNHLALCIDILRKYFNSKAFSKIPNILSELVSTPENIFEFNVGWQSSFTDRLFNKELRISEFNWHLLQRCKVFKEIPNDLTKPPWNISEGMVDTPIEIWMDSFSIDILREKVKFGLGYDVSNFCLSLKIPLKYPNVSIVYNIPHVGDVVGGICNTDICFDIINKEIFNLDSNSRGIQWYKNIVGNYLVVSILIPKNGNLPKFNSKNSDYHVNIIIRYQNGRSLISRLGGYNDAYKFLIPDSQ